MSLSNRNLKSINSSLNVSFQKIAGATYRSPVNYTDDISTPIQRWYRYREGYSTSLVRGIIQRYGTEGNKVILDPFCGSGSTLLEAKRMGLDSMGFEVNPFACLLSRVKTRNYSKDDKSGLEQIRNVISTGVDKFEPCGKPSLEIIDNLFAPDSLEFLLRCRKAIEDSEGVSQKSIDLARLAWLSILEDCSPFRKDGNGIRKRKASNFPVPNAARTRSILESKMEEMLSDMDYAIGIGESEPNVVCDTALRMTDHIGAESIGGAIFSPPYANCFNYTEIYKVELWMGGFVKRYEDLKLLRCESLRSHLKNPNVKMNSACPGEEPELYDLVSDLRSSDMCDEKIPDMVLSYFIDMFKVIDDLHSAIQPGGFCVITVSNSAYGGIVVPTDLLLAKHAERRGFVVEEIEVARLIVTSSQQCARTADYKDFLRESVIYLRKDSRT